MGHLLAKRLDCILDESLLCVNVEFTVALLSELPKSARSLSELVKVGEVLFIDVAKGLCELLGELGALRSTAIEGEKVSICVAGDVAHLI